MSFPTPQQDLVLKAREQDILVSAAAGAGKTTVMTEYIYRRIMEDEHPVHVDDLLVVTFTDAAAGQISDAIRERLHKALEDETCGDQDKKRIREELIRLPQAQISTIHGFCLNIIRNWFHVIELEPDFRICSDSDEVKMLENEVLAKLLEEEYERGSEAFLEAVEAYGGRKDDRDLADRILGVYHTAVSFPDPFEWLRDSLRLYDEDGKGAEDREALALVYVHAVAEELADLADQVRDGCLQPRGPEPWHTAPEADREFFEEIMASASMAEIERLAQAHKKWATMRGVDSDDPDIDEDIKNICKKKRESMKKRWNKLAQDFFNTPEETQDERRSMTRRQGEELVRLVERFDLKYAAYKRAKKIITFDDMEHLALEILRTKDDQGRDYVAAQYRDHFAEVLVDEYQDSNHLQDEIFHAVSGGSVPNLFMVGDVKQSIYRFRNARPEMFTEKQINFASYREGQEDKQVCYLIQDNFRSHEAVIDFVNPVFKHLMHESVGAINYTDDVELHTGADYYPDGPDRRSEIWVIPTSAGDERAAQEAACVAARIRELKATQQVYDKDIKGLRPLRYSDIKILSKTLSTWGDQFYEALTAEGIPLFMERKEGYFETQEVGIVIELLKLIGNARQDIPLAAVMASPIGRFTDDELARIRVAGIGCKSFHEAVDAYRAKEGADPLREKTDQFMRLIEGYRREAACRPVHRLIEYLLDETDLRCYFEAMPGGQQRRANLDLLVEKARAYAETGYRGLPRFLEYMAELDKQEIDAGEADVFDEKADVVCMTSIHKSKGLEFPVVFLVGMGREFNTTDRFGKILVHPELGLGLEALNTQTRQRSTTVVRDIIRHRITADDQGELMRLLYVGMTRAKEKLIITGCVKDVENETDLGHRYGMFAKQTLDVLPLERRLRAENFYDWVLPIALKIRQEDPGLVQIRITDADTSRQSAQHRAKTFDSVWARIGQKADDEMAEALAEAMAFPGIYKKAYGEIGEIPQKVSVSDIKRAQREKKQNVEDQGGKYIPDDVPKCIQGEGKISGARMGTVVHAALKALDFTCSWDAAALDAALTELAAKGYFTPEEAGQIDREELTAFLQSDLCARMAAASKEGRLWEERPFVIGADAREVDEDYPAGETVLVQGIIDAYFEEDGQIVLVDYKTDHRVDDRELTDRYEKQLAWYAQALERLTGMTVEEKIIYSLTLQREIRIK